MPKLDWIGKDKVISHHLDVPVRVLNHKYGFRANSSDVSETNSGNMIIHGDNLEALKALLPKYEGKVDCIYIDPPYNTGNENWIYNDSVNDPKIKKWLGEVVGTEGEDLCRHDKWLCMMYPRLVLLRELLSPTGSIFISINYANEAASLHFICDEIFGSNNFIGELTWESTTQPINSGSSRFNLQQKVEPILFYAKNKSQIPQFNLKINDTNLCYPHHGILGSCRFEIIEKSDAGGYKRDTMKYSILGQFPREGKRWQIGIETAQELLSRNRLEIVGGIVKKAIYPQDEEDKLSYVPFWSHLPASKVGTALSGKEELNQIMGKPIGFDTVKPSALIEVLLSYLPKNSIVLDSFAGSGTTAQAVLAQNKRDGGNRSFILIEMENYANDITAERVQRVISGYDYLGKQETEVFSEKLSWAKIKESGNIEDKVQSFFDSFIDNTGTLSAPRIVDNCVKIFFKKMASGHKDGLGGSFDFYELGEKIFTDDGFLNENISEDKIREYVYYSETRHPLSRSRIDNSFLLDTFNNTGFYFYYKPEEVTTFGPNTLNIVTEKADSYVVYADRCTLSEEYMLKHNIVFKKIPRDIKQF